MKRLLIVALALLLTTLVQAQHVLLRHSASDAYAASQLDSLLSLAGCQVTHAGRPQQYVVYVGSMPSTLRHCAAEVAALRDDGYCIVADGRTAYLCGAGERGTLFAVYAFLEKLGFRLYTPDALLVPDLSDLHIPVCREVSNPSFAYREVAYNYPNHSRLYADWHHLHNQADRHADWGMFVHTFARLLPPDRYFATHPEWYSLNNGRRSRDGQLCLSNEAMFSTLCCRLADTIASRPDAQIWSVSPNDNYNACQCAACRHLDSLYGSPTGTLIDFVNRLARRFPDKTIATLAYQYTRSASTVVPDSNVLIMLCPIEAGRQRPIYVTDTAFVHDIASWSRLTSNIFLWDYVVQFRNYWTPFPNLHVLQPNLRLFRDYGVHRMFAQASGADNVTSWMDIRCYLLAKLLWNVDADIDSIMSDFYRGYYGQQGHYVAEVVNAMTQNLLASGRRLDIYGYPIDGASSEADSVQAYLSPQAMRHYYTLMRRAEAEATDSAVAERLRFFRLTLDFARLELAYGNPSPRDIISQADSLERSLLHFHVPQMMEMGHSPSEYAAQMRHSAAKRLPNLATGSPVALRYAPTPPYNSGSLTDGRVGIMDYRHSWLGFWGDTLDAVVDLRQPTSISAVDVDFYYFPLSWIFLPERVMFSFSADSISWSQWQTISHEAPPLLARPDIVTHSLQLQPSSTTARYVRVVAIPPAAIPSWHRAAGQPAWLFADQIIVR